MTNQGWIKLHRKIKDWEWYNNPTVFYVWHHLLIEANYEDRSWQGITVKRGQLVIGVESFGKKINMSRQQIRHSIKNLQNSGEITIKTTNKYTIVTINNYNKYQEQPTNNQQTNQQTTTTKEYKNIRSKEIEDIYASYKELINKDSKLTEKAVLKIKARLKSFSLEDLLTCLKNFSSDEWWMENNSHRGIAWFFESDDRIDSFRTLKPRQKQTVNLGINLNSLNKQNDSYT